MVHVIYLGLLVLILASAVQGYPIQSNEMKILVSKLGDLSKGEPQKSLNSLRNHARFSKNHLPHFSVFSRNDDWMNTADGRQILQAVHSLSRPEHPANRQVLLDHMHQALDRLNNLQSHRDHSLLTNQVSNRQEKDSVHNGQIEINDEDESNIIRQHKFAERRTEQNGRLIAYRTNNNTGHENVPRTHVPLHVSRGVVNPKPGTNKAKSQLFANLFRAKTIASNGLPEKQNHNSVRYNNYKSDHQKIPAEMQQLGFADTKSKNHESELGGRGLPHSNQAGKITGQENSDQVVPVHTEVEEFEKNPGVQKVLPADEADKLGQFVIHGSHPQPQLTGETIVPGSTDYGSVISSDKSWGDVVETGKHDYSWDDFGVDAYDRTHGGSSSLGTHETLPEPIPLDNSEGKIGENSCAEAIIGPCRTDADCEFDVCQGFSFACVQSSCVFMGMADEHGAWLDKPFENIPEVQYIGKDDMVPEYVSDTATAPDCPEKNDQIYDWGFPEYDEKLGGQITSVRSVDKRKVD